MSATRSKTELAAEDLILAIDIGGTKMAVGLVDSDGNATFVSHVPASSTSANGEFDDQFTWITVGEFYGRLISAGQLP